MASEQPFTPVIGSVAGKSVILLATSSASNPGTVVSTVSAMATNLLVTNPSAVALFVRMSTEASPTATSADVPIPPNTSRLFGNPAPTGTAGIATIIASGSLGSNGFQIFAVFTPGNQGVE